MIDSQFDPSLPLSVTIEKINEIRSDLMRQHVGNLITAQWAVPKNKKSPKLANNYFENFGTLNSELKEFSWVVYPATVFAGSRFSLTKSGRSALWFDYEENDPANANSQKSRMHLTFEKCSERERKLNICILDWVKFLTGH